MFRVNRARTVSVVVNCISGKIIFKVAMLGFGKSDGNICTSQSLHINFVV